MHLFRNIIFALLLLVPPGLALAGAVDINTADVKELATLEGIGPQKAAAIVEHRNQHGPFSTVDDLTKVQGIGARTLDLNRDKMTAGTAAP